MATHHSNDWSHDKLKGLCCWVSQTSYILAGLYALIITSRYDDKDHKKKSHVSPQE